MNDLHQRRLFVWLISLLTSSFLFAQATPLLIGSGQTANVTVTTSNTQATTAGENTLSNEGFMPNNNAASRFLQQASFGPNYEEIMALGNTGLEDWIEQQFGVSRGFNCAEKVRLINIIKNAGAGTPDAGAFIWFWDYAFWEYSMTNSELSGYFKGGYPSTFDGTISYLHE